MTPDGRVRQMAEGNATSAEKIQVAKPSCQQLQEEPDPSQKTEELKSLGTWKLGLPGRR